MGYIPPIPAEPLRLNLDRFGMPKDFATYMWVVYKCRVEDDSPARRAFLYGAKRKDRNPLPDFGQQIAMR